MEIQLLEAAADYAMLAGIWERSVLATHHFVDKGDLDAIKKEMPAFLSMQKEIWLAIDNGQVRAFMACMGNKVEMLFVDADFLGRGAGSLLLEHAAKIHGPLQVTVNKQNVQALQFYLKKGFKIGSISPMDEQGRPYPICHMRQDA